MEATALLVAVEGLVVSLSVLELLDLRSVWALGVTLFPVGVFVAAVLVVAIRTGQSGARVAVAEAPDQPGVVHRDDDRYWWAGQVYVNHDDPAWLVPKRFGSGYTVNFGHRHGWLVLAILLLFIAAGPILATLASH
jgi:uncharacterized membrane protein